MIKTDLNALFLEISLHAKEDIFLNLPKDLYYHQPEHTFGDVLPHALKLAKLENVNQTDLFLLKVAVLFHDAGFIQIYHQNEEIGALLAERELQKYTLPEEYTLIVKQIIMATNVNKEQNGHIQCAGDSILEQIICDADLDNLGREDFFERGEALRKELAVHGTVMTEKEWCIHQIGFLKSHCYYTRHAHMLRDAGKARNLDILNERLKKTN
jgi:predicted metal-dependent HD superfamily phosphohydrolase